MEDIKNFSENENEFLGKKRKTNENLLKLKNNKKIEDKTKNLAGMIQNILSKKNKISTENKTKEEKISSQQILYNNNNINKNNNNIIKNQQNIFSQNLNVIMNNFSFNSNNFNNISNNNNNNNNLGNNNFNNINNLNNNSIGFNNFNNIYNLGKYNFNNITFPQSSIYNIIKNNQKLNNNNKFFSNLNILNNKNKIINNNNNLKQENKKEILKETPGLTFGEMISKMQNNNININNNNNINKNIFNKSINNNIQTNINNINLKNSGFSNINYNYNININNNNNNINKTKNNDSLMTVSLQNYINRAINQCKTKEEINICNINLRHIIESASKNNEINTRNWDNFPLPNKTILTDATLFTFDYSKNNNLFNNKNKLNNLNKNNMKQSKQRKSKIIYNKNSEEYFLTMKNEIIKPSECNNIEKEYYRMNELPDPNQIRPENILKKSLKMLKEKYESNKFPYKYFEEQFRSIRQDLTIQSIQNDFSLDVYETNARIALKNYDVGNFNQCQTLLIPLYEKGIKGSEIEFLCYRIIYTSLMENKESINIIKLIKKKFNNSNNNKNNKIIKKKNNNNNNKNNNNNNNSFPFEIEYSLKILKSLNENNYFKFFELYQNSPFLSKYLIEPFLPRLRIKALINIAYGFYSEISIKFVQEKIAFKNIKECKDFLEKNKLKIGFNKKGEEILFCRENFNTLNNSPLLLTLIQKNF